MPIKLKPETALHISFCDYLCYQYPGIMIHHSPNEGKRSGFLLWLIKRLRIGSGFPDLFLIYKEKVCTIELKAIKMNEAGKMVQTSKESKNQNIWIAALNFAKIPSKTCVGFDQAKEFVNSVFDKV